MLCWAVSAKVCTRGYLSDSTLFPKDDNRTQYLDDSNYGKRTSALTGHVDDADPSSDLQLTSDRL